MIENDNPRTYWIILKDGVEEFNRKIFFNVVSTDDENLFHLWKTRKWARKVARESGQTGLLVYRTIVPVGGLYKTEGEKEIWTNTILVKNDKVYEP